MQEVESITREAAISAQTTQIEWDSGTAYDFFISLKVLHEPEEWGLRGAWAAGVRSRLPVENREFLKAIMPAFTSPLAWISQLPQPKDSQTVLDGLAVESAEKRLRLVHNSLPEEVLASVAQTGRWQPSDVKAVQREYKKHGKSIPKKAVEAVLAQAVDVDAYGEQLLAALTAFQQNFYAEEEKRIEPYLKAQLAAIQKSAETLSLQQLLEKSSGGVRLSREDLDKYQTNILAPSFWATPFLVLDHDEQGRGIYLFGARPDDVSLVPGEVIPDALYLALKALADPTRLKILRYLSAEPHTPTQLANKLRLRPPTVIHHLRVLRLAQLVHVTPTTEGRRYAARSEALDDTLANLRHFLNV